MARFMIIYGENAGKTAAQADMPLMIIYGGGAAGKPSSKFHG